MLVGIDAFYESVCHVRRLGAREKMRNHSAMAVNETALSAWLLGGVGRGIMCRGCCSVAVVASERCFLAVYDVNLRRNFSNVQLLL